VKGVVRTVTAQIAGVSTVRIDIPLEFIPGQSVKVHFPGDEKARYFSVSSSPTEGHYVEVTVKPIPESTTAKAIAGLKRGDAIELEGPFGKTLTLPEPLPNVICFIAAGTGVTPFRAMIKSLIDTNADADLWLLHSVKTRAELLFQAEFSEWSGLYQRFHYVPTLTQDFDDDWKNETGRINEVLLRKHIPIHPATYLLCGPGTFVADMEEMLKHSLKVEPQHIRREQS
jgi:ferredoxin-NADP reductase